MAMNFETALDILAYCKKENYVPLCQIAHVFELKEKQVLEYITQLREISIMTHYEEFIDIDVERDDPDHVWISTRNTLGVNQPLRFTTSEVVAIMGGLRFLESQPNVLRSEVVSSLIDKLSSVFGEVDPGIEIDVEQSDPTLVKAINQAIDQELCIEIEYGTKSDNSVSRRVIEPVLLILNEGNVTVRAYCHLAQDMRSFRVDRILKHRLTSEKSTHLKDVAVDNDMESAQLSVRLRMNPDFLEEFAPATILETKVSGERVEAHIRVSAFSWIASLVLASGGEIEVLEPPQLKEIVIEKAQKWKQLNAR